MILLYTTVLDPLERLLIKTGESVSTFQIQQWMDTSLISLSLSHLMFCALHNDIN